MTIEDENKIDILAVNSAEKTFDLTISDHLSWDQGQIEHLYALQEKVNCYFLFIESGQLAEMYPDKSDWRVCIKINSMHAIPEEVEWFFDRMREIAKEAGYELKVEVSRPTLN